MLLYAFGVLWMIFAQASWMLIFGYFVVGLTVGADVPASWTLITETAPNDARGRVAGLAQVLWYVGPSVPLVLGIALLGLGDTMPRILFAQLFVVALITWALRQSIVESAVWTRAQEHAAGAASAFSELFQRRHVRALAFLILMYGVWNLVAGTYGFFFPYILRRRRLHDPSRHLRAAGDLVRIHGTLGRLLSTCLWSTTSAVAGS